MKELDGGITPLPTRPRPVGPRATAAWLSSRGLYASPSSAWDVTVGLDDDARKPSAHLHIALDAIEWGFRFEREGRTSWIRVMNAPCVHECDDFDLLRKTPHLRNLPSLVRYLEDRFGIWFRRAHANVRTSLPNAEDKVRLWVVASL